MAVPTITSVTPATGPAGGRNFVTITGTNFRVPAELLSPYESVKVEVDGIESVRVDVLSETIIKVIIPPYQGEGVDAKADPIPAIGVRVYNLDVYGNAIAGETVTKASAYTYYRSAIRSPRATRENQIYTQIINSVIWAFRRQLVPSVSIGTSIDFGEVGATEVKLATLPAVALAGPRIEEDMINRHRWEGNETDSDDMVIYPPPWVGTFEFDAILASNNKAELYGMIQGEIEMFMRTPYLEIPIDPTTPNDGYYSFPFVLMAAAQTQVQESNSDLHVAASTFQVRRIPFRTDEPVDLVNEVLEGYIDLYGNIDLID